MNITQNERELLNQIEALGYCVAGASYLNDEEAKKGNHSARFWQLPSQNYRLACKLPLFSYHSKV